MLFLLHSPEQLDWRLKSVSWREWKTNKQQVFFFFFLFKKKKVFVWSLLASNWHWHFTFDLSSHKCVLFPNRKCQTRKDGGFWLITCSRQQESVLKIMVWIFGDFSFKQAFNWVTKWPLWMFYVVIIPCSFKCAFNHAVQCLMWDKIVCSVFFICNISNKALMKL